MLYVNKNFGQNFEKIKQFLEKNGPHHQRWHDVTHDWN